MNRCELSVDGQRKQAADVDIRMVPCRRRRTSTGKLATIGFAVVMLFALLQYQGKIDYTFLIYEI